MQTKAYSLVVEDTVCGTSEENDFKRTGMYVTMNYKLVYEHTDLYPTQQEPFDIDGSILRDWKGESLEQCLRSLPDLDNFLGTMCEFVETYLRHNIAEKQDWT